MSLKISQKNGLAVLKGTFDEFADYSALANIPEPLKLDLAAVERFNSVGLRNFMLFLQRYGKPVQYHNCTQEFIDQINMLPSLLKVGNTEVTVHSCEAPYVCDDCEVETVASLNKTGLDTIAAGGDAPKIKCSHCKKEINEVMSGYFQFLDTSN